jgi:hypothetical protein
MRITATSSPSLGDVEEIIVEQSAWIAARLRDVGVGPDLTDGSETHGIARGILYDLVVAAVDTLRGREDTKMTEVQRRADARIAAIDLGPQGLGDDAAASRNHRVTTSARRSREVREYNENKAGRGIRMATRREL